MECKEVFIKGLSAYMERCRYSQQDVAAIIGKSVQNVSQILKGKNGITYENMTKLFEAGMLLEEAFGEDLAAVILASQKDAVVDGEKLSPEQIVLQGLRYLRDNSPAELDSLIQGLKF